jgi:hypothetical protein
MQQLLPVHRFARDPAAYCIKTCAWFCSTVPLQLTVNVRYIFTFHPSHFITLHTSHCTLHTSHFPIHTTQFTLTIQRVPIIHHTSHRAVNDPVWAAFVADIGKGQPAVFPATCVVTDVNALIEAVWPGGSFMCDDNRGILTMTREDAATINKRVMAAFVGDADIALSLDKALVIFGVVFSFHACVCCVCAVITPCAAHAFRVRCWHCLPCGLIVRGRTVTLFTTRLSL